MHIVETPAYRKAFVQYLRKGTAIELLLKALNEKRPTTHYIWRTQGDNKVRSSHAANNGKIFAWDNPPETGHPGEDYNCRCTAEPYVEGKTEFAQQDLTSVVPDNPKKWETTDFVLHYYLGGGRIVTLPDIGHLKGMIDYYFYEIVRKGKNSYERVNNQIIAEARKRENGAFTYSFNNSYPEFRQYLYLFGGGTVSGNFNGNIQKKNGLLIVQGAVDYHYKDTFTDILSIREKITHGTSEPLDASILALLATDFYGVFFDIVGRWQTHFYAEIKENIQEGKY